MPAFMSRSVITPFLRDHFPVASRRICASPLMEVIASMRGGNKKSIY